MRSRITRSVVAVCAGVVFASPARAVDIGTAFFYQGRLVKNGTPVTSMPPHCDFTFGLWDAATMGDPKGNSPQSLGGVAVTDGLFTVSLDFGPAGIDGTARWLEVAVQCPGDAMAKTLAPRQELKPAPHALALPGLYTQQNGAIPNIIGGFSGNAVTAAAVGATISGGGNGGVPNRVTDSFETVGGGFGNQAGDNAGTTEERAFATVGGGVVNVASGAFSMIGGGINNTANGAYSAVPGGAQNTAAGSTSFAAGLRAQANHAGAFVWGDSTNSDIASSAPNEFTARTTGGAVFYTNTAYTTGVAVPAGAGSWSSVSDRAVKRNVKRVEPLSILEHLAGVPISTWNYESQDPSIRHVGPMAQDFHAAFGVGENERFIATIDADGVALAAIQGLHQLVQEKDCRLVQMLEENDRRIGDLEERNIELEARIEALLMNSRTTKRD